MLLAHPTPGRGAVPPLLAVLLAASVVLSGCGSGDAAAPSAGRSEPSIDEPATPVDGAHDLSTEIEARMDDDGHVPLGDTLELVAATFGPVDGVQPADVVGAGQTTQSFVADLAADHWGDLDPEQRRAVAEAILGRSAAGAVEVSAPSPGPATDEQLAELGDPDESGSEVGAPAPIDGGSPQVRTISLARRDRVATAQGYLDLVGLFLAGYERRMGITLSQNVRLRLVDREFPVGDALAITDAFRVDLEDATAGPFIDGVTPDDVGSGDCFIQVGAGLANRQPDTIRAALAHEAFHCVQIALRPNDLELPPWLHEGSAAWAGETISTTTMGTQSSVNWWNSYLSGSDGGWSLRRSAYSAIGFFAHFAESGDMWQRLRVALADGFGDSFWISTITGGSSSAMATFASAPARRSSWGPAWNTTPSGVTTDAHRSPLPILGGPGSENLRAPVGNQLWRADPGGGTAVISVAASGYGRLRIGEDGPEVVVSASAGPHEWCTLQPCVCPDGSPVPGGPYATLPTGARGQPLTIALASYGDASVSEARVTFRSLEELCEDQPTTTTDPGDGPWFRVDGPLATTITGGRGCTMLGTMLIADFGAGAKVASITVTAAQAGANAGPSMVWSLDEQDGAAIDSRSSTAELGPDLRSGRVSGSAVGVAGGRKYTGAVNAEFHC